MVIKVNTRTNKLVWIKLNNLLVLLNSLYFIVRFGKITCKVEDCMDAWGSSKVCAESYHARGKQIGWWEYGHFDPFAPYQGQNLKPWCFKNWSYRHC